MIVDLDLQFTINIQYEINMNNIDYCIDSKDKNFCKKVNIFDIEAFEKVMDILDKEWFMKKQNLIEKIEMIGADEICDVCTKKEFKDNPILVCQGCGVSVHRDCYGSSYSKEEFFLCQCCINFDLNHTCIFCNTNGGAMKMTSDFRFGHILCVLFDKSLDFDNPISKEPIFTGNFKSIKGLCVFCKNTRNTKIECSFGLCMNIYHMGCGIDKVYFDISNKISYCILHDPTLKKNLFTSNAFFKSLYSGYVKLRKKPIIRQKKPMKIWENTEYNKIINCKPDISINLFIKLKDNYNEDFIKTICEYWTTKRQVDKKYGIHYLRHTKR